MKQDPTGEQLCDELRVAAHASGVSLARFCAPLFKGESWKIEQLRIARKPLRRTVERVRALIAGEPVPEAPPSPLRGRPQGHGRHRITDGDTRMTGDEIARRRALTDVAHAQRRPGETLHQAVNRLAGPA